MSSCAPIRVTSSRHFSRSYNGLPKTSRRYSTALNHFVGNKHEDAQPISTTLKPFRLAVKDNIATAHQPTTCASDILSNHTSPFEATIVRQLRDRGAVIVGKTNMDEFGMGSHSTHSCHGAVRNPASEVPVSAGGSSGGSAVAVRTGEADVALGTDTGGSVRMPAAYTGVVGFKPSYGMLSRWGVVPYANSLDTVGLLARDVEVIRDLVIGSGLHMEHDSSDPTSLSESSRRRFARSTSENQPLLEDFRGSQITVGLPLEYNIEELDPEIRRCWEVAATRLSANGVKVVPVSLPTTKHALSAYYVLAPAEASSNLSKYDGVRYGTQSGDNQSPGDVLYAGTRGAGFGDEVKRRILLGTYTLSSEAMDNYFIQAQRVRRLVQRDFDRVFVKPNPLYDAQHFDLSDVEDIVGMEDKLGPTQVDFILCPTLPSFPPRLEDIENQSPVDVYMSDVFTVPTSLAGLPAISIPFESRTKEQRSVGLQVIGQYWDDARLLDFSRRMQSEVLA